MIVIEKDVVFTTNSYLQIMWVIRELFRNPAYGATKLVNLVVSQDRLDHMTKIVRAAEEAAPPSAHDFYYQMVPHPWQAKEKPRQDEYTLANIGQGARAYAVHTSWAMALLEKKVRTWWDVWMHEEVCLWGMKNAPDDEVARFLYPPMGYHPYDKSDASRGSERMQWALPNHNARFCKYLCLNLSTDTGIGWGGANRINTLAIVLTMASKLGLGLHVLWPPDGAVGSGNMSAALATCADYCDTLPGLPFLQIHNALHHYKPQCRKYNNPQCVGELRFQCVPDLFLLELQKQLVAKQCPKHWLEQITKVSTYTYFAAGYQCMQPAAMVKGAVIDYLARWPDQQHIAIHVRRGDMKQRNMSSKGKGAAAEHGMWGKYQEADREVEAVCLKLVRNIGSPQRQTT